MPVIDAEVKHACAVLASIEDLQVRDLLVMVACTIPVLVCTAEPHSWLDALATPVPQSKQCIALPDQDCYSRSQRCMATFLIARCSIAVGTVLT